MHERERDMTKESFSRQPEEHGRVLTNAPKHRKILKLVESLAHDVNALLFQFRKVIHGKIVVLSIVKSLAGSLT